MHDGEWMGLDEGAQQLDGVSSHVAALILETAAGELCSLLSSFGELLLQVAEFHINLQGPASAVRVDVEKAFLEDVEEGVELRFVVLATFILLAEIGNHVSANFDEGATECV